MSYRVLFAPEALAQMDALERYIAEAGSPAVASRYVDSIVNFCERLQTFPQRGPKRDDIMPGLRITHYRHRTVIAFFVDEPAEIVSVVGVFYGGRDYETMLRGEGDQGPATINAQ